MIEEPIYYKLGDFNQDGHEHLFTINGLHATTSLSKGEEEPIPHSHGIGVVGDLLHCSVSHGTRGPHMHYVVERVRPIDEL